MKVTFIGHASLLVEAGRLRILSDPWWVGPCFGTQWWHYPLPETASVTEGPIHHIYVSHGHDDHYHPPTLRSLDRSAKVLVSKDVDLGNAIRRLGFEVIELDDGVPFDLGGGVECRVSPTVGGDSLMTITDGAEVCVNLNDALHSAPSRVQDEFIERLLRWHPTIDYLFCGYGVASHFPNCYVVPGKDRVATAARRQHHFNEQWVKLASGLRPRFAFPFAADVVLLQDDLFWANEPTHNTERPTDLFRERHPSSTTEVVDIAPGFRIENGAVTDAVVREPLQPEKLRSDLAESIRIANQDRPLSRAAVETAAELLRANIDRSKTYFLERDDGPYVLCIKFRSAEPGIVIERKDGSIDVRVVDRIDEIDSFDVRFVTRLHYLRASLTRPYGDEILFVGSGGIFEYAERAHGRLDLHQDLRAMMTYRKSALPPRYHGRPRWLRRLRGFVKRCLGRTEADLYGLSQWTVFLPKAKLTSR